MADPKWSDNLILNPSAGSALANWTTTGTVATYAKGSDDAVCFNLSANSSMSQTLGALLFVPGSFQLQIDSHSDESLIPSIVIVKITATYNEAKTDTYWMPLALLTSTDVIVDGWIWKRTTAELPVRDPSTMNDLIVKIITLGTSSPLYIDNIQCKAELDIPGVINMSDRKITGDVIMEGTLDVTALIVGTLTGWLIQTAKIIGLENEPAIIEIGDNGGYLDTHEDVTPGIPDRAAMRLVPGSLSAAAGYLQIIEDGALWLYGPDGVEYAYIRPEYDAVNEVYYGITNLFPAVVIDGVVIQFAQIWVQDTAPTAAQNHDVWINPLDHSRYDITTVSTNTTLEISDNEIITASGTISITLHAATAAGIIKKIYNVGTGIVTVIGTINGVSNMRLFPTESVELITDGSGWRY